MITPAEGYMSSDLIPHTARQEAGGWWASTDPRLAGLRLSRDEAAGSLLMAELEATGEDPGHAAALRARFGLDAG